MDYLTETEIQDIQEVVIYSPLKLKLEERLKALRPQYVDEFNRLWDGEAHTVWSLNHVITSANIAEVEAFFKLHVPHVPVYEGLEVSILLHALQTVHLFENVPFAYTWDYTVSHWNLCIYKGNARFELNF